MQEGLGKVVRMMLAAALLCSVPAMGQGRTTYMNVESPQVHPLELAQVDGHTYLAVCNTPDNSIEIWDTDESLPIANRFLLRIRVGLEPVTVRFHAGRSWLYVANFLGDSISIIELSGPSGPSSLAAKLLQTTYVGDEPVDIAFYDKDPAGVARETLFVTHMTLDGWGWRDALTLDALPGLALIDAAVQKGDLDGDTLPDQIALKEPRAIAVHNDCLLILGMKGGNESASVGTDPTYFDYALYIVDLTALTVSDLGQLGSTNFNMTLSNGDLFVVSGEALNETRLTEPVVATAPTGFVESFVYMVKDVCGPAPQVKGRDVNLVSQAVIFEPPNGLPLDPLTTPTSKAAARPIEPLPLVGPAKKKDALAQLTSIVAFTPPGGSLKVFFTAFGSDRVGVLEPNFATNPNTWPRRKINVSLAGAPNVAKAGPRALALMDGPMQRLYVLNRLENSLTIIDPVAETELDNVRLNHDPRPDYILIGQRFLYDAKLSGNGFDSCASCHTDARTDGLAWHLGTPATAGPAFPAGLDDMIGNPVLFNWPDDKEFMVTQSLQGLLNFELDPTTQQLTTNAPYHWRGDNATFIDFNPAFVSLLGRNNELTDDQMEDYEEYINSVHYPPNPKQPLGRAFSGDFGDPDSVDAVDPNRGTGAQLGMKIYHMLNSDSRSCVHCHALPEGSNNKLTEFIEGDSPFDRAGLPLANQPIETAALRGLFQKEARLDRSGSDFPQLSPLSGLEGMAHTGFFSDQNILLPNANRLASINAFNQFFFSDMCQTPVTPGVFELCDELEALNQFVHEMDWGVAPLAGIPYTADDRVHDPVDPTSLNLANLAAQVLQDQAKVANIGLAAQFFSASGDRGFWYDVTGVAPTYREEPGGSPFTFQGLLNLLTTSDDRLVLTGTPLGSERRVASPTTAVSQLSNTAAPDYLMLQPMRPNTAYADVPQMTRFWAELTDPTNPSLGYEEDHGGFFPHVVRLFQHALIGQGFGLEEIRHDPSRRFRVSGKNILQGAKLLLYRQDQIGGPAPDPTLPIDDPNQPTLLEIELPIHPTDEVLADGSRTWETAVELDALMYYMTMLGGPHAPGVQNALLDQGPPVNPTFNINEPPLPTDPFQPDPQNWNWIGVKVKNPDNQVGDGGWQRLTLD
ncbi:MAG: hypothetical protein AAF657_00060 [Acidobacteriota bacterium]